MLPICVLCVPPKEDGSVKALIPAVFGLAAPQPRVGARQRKIRQKQAAPSEGLSPATQGQGRALLRAQQLSRAQHGLLRAAGRSAGRPRRRRRPEVCGGGSPVRPPRPLPRRGARARRQAEHLARGDAGSSHPSRCHPLARAARLLRLAARRPAPRRPPPSGNSSTHPRRRGAPHPPRARRWIC